MKTCKDNQKNASLTKKSFKQALLYVVTFITTFGAPIIGYGIIGLSNANAVVGVWILSVFFSPYGIFLILIYTKPKVDKLSEMFPGSPWRSRFSVVIFAGGEVPPAQELREPPNFPRMNEREEQNEVALSWPSAEDIPSEECDAVYKDLMMKVSRSEGWSIFE